MKNDIASRFWDFSKGTSMEESAPSTAAFHRGPRLSPNFSIESGLHGATRGFGVVSAIDQDSPKFAKLAGIPGIGNPNRG